MIGLNPKMILMSLRQIDLLISSIYLECKWFKMGVVTGSFLVICLWWILIGLLQSSLVGSRWTVRRCYGQILDDHMLYG